MTSASVRTQTDLMVGAFEWIESNLDRFNPIGDDIQPDALRNKALAELAFLCDYTRRARPEMAPIADRILAFVADIWDRAEYRDLIVRNPESLQLYVLTYDSLLHSGYPVSAAAPVIQGVIDAGYATSVEAVPFRLMDMRHVFDYGGFRHDLPSMEALLARTMVAQQPPLPYLTTADVYCVTHTLFYLTDFGFGKYTDSGLMPYFQRIVDNLLGLYVRLEDWDLTAELLISQRCVGNDAGAIGKAAWQALLAAQRPDGSVPAPGYRPDGAEARRDAGEYGFEHNYHTTLVVGLAAALVSAP